MSVHRTPEEQDWRDHDEGLYDPDVIVEREREDRRFARLDEMSWPTGEISVERVRPGQPEFEPRHVRSHEVRSYGKTSWVEWLFLISGFGLCAAWLLLLAAVMYAVTVG